MADEHALQVIAFPEGLDNQRFSSNAKSDAPVTVAPECDSKVNGWRDRRNKQRYRSEDARVSDEPPRQ
jgi:hypothetical protein